MPLTEADKNLVKHRRLIHMVDTNDRQHTFPSNKVLNVVEGIKYAGATHSVTTIILDSGDYINVPQDYSSVVRQIFA